MGRIILEGMKFFSHIGTSEEEREAGNEITVNLSYKTDTQTPALSDNLNDAVDYSLIYQTVKNETLTPCNLIENLAWRIMKSLQKNFPEISEIELQLFKHYPRVDGKLEKSGIVLTSTS
jgi:dihydroneopterin aldolase